MNNNNLHFYNFDNKLYVLQHVNNELSKLYTLNLDQIKSTTIIKHDYFDINTKYDKNYITRINNNVLLVSLFDDFIEVKDLNSFKVLNKININIKYSNFIFMYDKIVLINDSKSITKYYMGTEFNYIEDYKTNLLDFKDESKGESIEENKNNNLNEHNYMFNTLDNIYNDDYRNLIRQLNDSPKKYSHYFEFNDKHESIDDNYVDNYKNLIKQPDNHSE